MERGDKIVIDGILHHVAQTNPFLANSKTESNAIIRELKIQMQYQNELNSLKPKPNMEYNSILVFSYSAFSRMFEKKVKVHCLL